MFRQMQDPEYCTALHIYLNVFSCKIMTLYPCCLVICRAREFCQPPHGPAWGPVTLTAEGAEKDFLMPCTASLSVVAREYQQGQSGSITEPCVKLQDIF